MKLLVILFFYKILVGLLWFSIWLMFGKDSVTMVVDELTQAEVVCVLDTLSVFYNVNIICSYILFYNISISLVCLL